MIPRNQNVERTLRINLDEVRDLGSDLIANHPVGRNGRANGDHTVAREQFALQADAADVGIAVFLGEAETFGEVRAYYIAIKKLHLGFMGPQAI